MYLNRANKERVVTLIVLDVIFSELEQQEEKMKEMFGKGWTWLKSSRTFLRKSLAELKDNVGPDESHKLYNVARHSTFAVMSKFTPQKDIGTLPIDINVLYGLAEMAIGNHCKGCTKCDYKKCHVFQTMQKADIPAAVEVKNDCPYRQ
jgi:hypothetical protein